MKNSSHISGSQQVVQKSNTYLIQLERATNDLIQSTITLNSYSNEPKTKELFELKSMLKQKFKQVLQENSLIKQGMHQKKINSSDLMERIKIQIKTLDQLHQEIKEYCGFMQNQSGFTV